MADLYSWAISIFVDVLQIALPIAIVFNFGNLIVDTFMSTAFGGKIWFGRR